MDTKKYGKTDVELDSDKMIQAREIVATILDFGITQEQIIRIIKLLGLELINRDHMIKVVALAKSLEEAPAQTSIIT